MTDTFDQLVQRQAEQHLNACFEAMEARETDTDRDIPNPAYGPFCGCNTCTVREILSVTWDLMEAEARRRVLAEISDFGRVHQGATTEPIECPDCPPGMARIDCPGHPHPTEIEDLCDADD